MNDMRLLPLLILSAFICVSCGTASRHSVPLTSEVVVKARDLNRVYEICSQPDEFPFINFQKGTAVAVDYDPEGEGRDLGEHLKRVLKQKGMKIVKNVDRADVVISVADAGLFDEETGEKVKKEKRSVKKFL